MRRRDKTKKERRALGLELGDLERSIRERLEQTGLVMHIRFHYGHLEDNKAYISDEAEEDLELPEQIGPNERTKNPSYIEFKRNEDQRVVHGDCRRLRASIFEIITQLVPGTMGMNYAQPYPGVYRACPILYPEFEVGSPKEIHVDMLEKLNKLLEAYLSRNPLRKIR